MSGTVCSLRRSGAGDLLLISTLILSGTGASWSAYGQDVAKGRRLYDQHCASCHGLDGKSRFPDVPDLRHAGAGGLPGFAAVNKLRMGTARKPPFLGKLSDQQLMDTLLYARTLK
jgi:mono/diheme cytochrome c family protein